MNLVPILRVARPTDQLAVICKMYIEGLDLTVLVEFKGHGKFDGVILGQRQQPYHLEFTTEAGQRVGKAPTPENILAFFVPDPTEYDHRCAKMLAAGFQPVKSYNEYWDANGSRTFEDVDGYRVVIWNAIWPF